MKRVKAMNANMSMLRIADMPREVAAMAEWREWSFSAKSLSWTRSLSPLFCENCGGGGGTYSWCKGRFCPTCE